LFASCRVLGRKGIPKRGRRSAFRLTVMCCGFWGEGVLGKRHQWQRQNKKHGETSSTVLPPRPKGRGSRSHLIVTWRKKEWELQKEDLIRNLHPGPRKPSHLYRNDPNKNKEKKGKEGTSGGGVESSSTRTLAARRRKKEW